LTIKGRGEERGSSLPDEMLKGVEPDQKSLVSGTCVAQERRGEAADLNPDSGQRDCKSSKEFMISG